MPLDTKKEQLTHQSKSPKKSNGLSPGLLQSNKFLSKLTTMQKKISNKIDFFTNLPVPYSFYEHLAGVITKLEV